MMKLLYTFSHFPLQNFELNGMTELTNDIS